MPSPGQPPSGIHPDMSLDELDAALDVMLAGSEGSRLPALPGGLSVCKRTYPDARPGHGPHEAIVVTVTEPRQIKVSDLLVELLGEADAAALIAQWGDRVDFSEDAPTSNSVVLFLDSNNKRRTTQEEDFKGAGLTFADDIQATIVCAVLVKKARDAGLDLSKDASTWEQDQSAALSRLDPLQIDLLSKLHVGYVRSCSGALRVDGNGRLRAYDLDDRGYANIWAFGGVPPVE